MVIEEFSLAGFTYIRMPANGYSSLSFPENIPLDILAASRMIDNGVYQKKSIKVKGPWRLLLLRHNETHPRDE